LNIGDDPSTTANLTWRTSTEVREAWAEIAEGTHGPELSSRSTQLPAVSEALLTDLNTAHFHSVKIRNLKPGTCYSYRVGDGVNWSEWFQFRTASDSAQPFSFLYFGDAQNDILLDVVPSCAGSLSRGTQGVFHDPRWRSDQQCSVGW
jgi:phosphodiesterase/alkaline phosphatase D-like protein